MQLQDILSISLAAVILTAGLAVREVSRERRQVQVFLDFVLSIQFPWVRIVNNSFRPMTITRIEIWTYKKFSWRYVFMQSLSVQPTKNQDFDDPEQFIPLPINLADRDSIGFTFDSEASRLLWVSYFWSKFRRNLLTEFKDQRARLFIVDASGKYYEARKGNMYHPRDQASPIKSTNMIGNNR